MPFQPGQSGNPAGRKHGQLNKLTRTVKEAFEGVFEELQKPLEDGSPNPASLIEFAKKKPDEFYKIAKVLIPQKLEHAGGVNVAVVTGIPQAEDKAHDDIA